MDSGQKSKPYKREYANILSPCSLELDSNHLIDPIQKTWEWKAVDPLERRDNHLYGSPCQRVKTTNHKTFHTSTIIMEKTLPNHDHNDQRNEITKNDL